MRCGRSSGGASDLANEASPKAQRRIGRRTARGCLWAVLGLGLLAFLATLLLESAWFEGVIEQRLVQAVERGLDREVSVASFDIDLLPLSVAVQDLVIAGPTATPDAPDAESLPFVRVDSVDVLLAVRGVVDPTIEILSVDVEHPVVRINLGEDGSHDVPLWQPADPESQGSVSVELGSLHVRDGVFVLDDSSTPFALDASGVTATLAGASGDVEGRVHVDALAFDLQNVIDDGPFEARLDASVTIARGAVTVSEIELSGEHLEIAGSGTAAWMEGERRIDLDLEAESSARLLERLGFVDSGLLAGDFSWQGDFRYTADEVSGEGVWGVRGELRSASLELAGQPVSDINIETAVDRHAVSAQLRDARFAGGRLAGGLAMDLDRLPASPSSSNGDESGRGEPSTLQLELHEGQLAELLTNLGSDRVPVDGRLTGELEYRFHPSRALEGNGVAHLSVETLADSEPEVGSSASAKPIQAEVPLLIEAGVVSSQAIRARLPSQTLRAAGSYEISTGSGQLDAALTSQDLAALWQLVLGSPEEVTGVATVAAQPMLSVQGGTGEIRSLARLTSGAAELDVDFDLEGVLTDRLAVDRASGSFRFLPGQEERPWAVESLAVELTDQGDDAKEATARLNGQITGAPSSGSVADASQAPELQLAIDLASWPLESLGALSSQAAVLANLGGYVSADVGLQQSGRISMVGRVDELSLILAEAQDAHRNEIELGQLQLEANLADGTLLLDRALLALPAGDVQLSGQLPYSQDSAQLQVELSAPALDLSRSPFDWLPLVPAPHEDRPSPVDASLCFCQGHTKRKSGLATSSNHRRGNATPSGAE